ncbi:MAG: SDR family NAD(P)-dependent oxidoreductase [Bacteroidota bacterium]
MKTILITGSTDGIGKLAATTLAKEGHRVLVHGRNPVKLEQTVSEINAMAHNAQIAGFVADLSDFGSIQRMVTELDNEFSRIDVLINNAGVFKSARQQNQNKLDMRFAVNYFAPYLLTNGLIPLLKNGTSPRVLNLSSAAQSTVSLGALAGKETLSVQAAYAQSKLALTMWGFHLSKMHDWLNVIAVNPGSLLNTKMVQEAYGQYWGPATKGAEIICDLAVSEKHAGRSGQYYDNDKGAFAHAHPDAYKEQLVNDLISTTDALKTI